MTSKPYPFPYAWTYKEVTGSWRSTSHTTHIIPVGEKNDVILQFWPQKDGSTVTHCDVRGLDNRPHFIIKHKPSESDKKLVFQYDCPKDGYKDFATFKYSSRTFKIPADSDSQPLTAKFSVVHIDKEGARNPCEYTWTKTETGLELMSNGISFASWRTSFTPYFLIITKEGLDRLLLYDCIVSAPLQDPSIWYVRDGTSTWPGDMAHGR